MIHRYILALLFSVSILAYSTSSAQGTLIPKITKPVTRVNPSLVRQTSKANTVQPGLAKPVIINNSTKISSRDRSSILTFTPTTINNGKGRISASIKLGKPFIKSGVSGAEIVWPSIAQGHLPSGVTFISADTSSKSDCLAITLAVPVQAKNFAISTTNAAIHSFQEARSAVTLAEPRAILGKPTTFRSLRSVTLLVPISYLDHGKLIAVEQCSFTVMFDAGSNITSSEADPLFERTYQALAANTSDIPSFRAPLRNRNAQRLTNKTPLGGTPTPYPFAFESGRVNWINPQAPYLKLTVVRDGIYRITSDELKNRSGYDVSSWSADSIRLFNRGNEVAIWLEKSVDNKLTAIEFYGEHLKGDREEYYNVSTDSNAYWLTNSSPLGGKPLRYELQQLPNVGYTVPFATVKLHHEKDLDYYPGDASSDESATLHRSQWIDGETFIWRRLSKPDGKDTSRIIDTVNLSALPGANGTATITVVARGISNDFSTSDENHRVRVKVNGDIIGEQRFTRFDSVHATISFNPSQLKLGENIIEIQSAGTFAEVDEFYVDNYELVLTGPVGASVDTAVAKGQVHFTVAPEQSSFNVEVVSPNVYLYNFLTHKRIEGQVAQGKTILTDAGTASSQMEYVGATPGNTLSPVRIQQWNIGQGEFASWRLLSKSNGADYIIITNPIFTVGSQPAQRLRLSRESAGLRSLLVTTDEIFNTFNYGSDEPLALRHFLKYAYENYAGNAPGFVTLFGDATWDPKFNLNNTTKEPKDRTIHRSLVPTFGNPASDHLFVVFEGTAEDTVTPQMILGRISVETPEEADQYLSKLFEYEASKPAEWNRNFLFIVGGDGGQQFQEFRTNVNDFLYSPEKGNLAAQPTNVRPSIIERRVFDGLDQSQAPSIQSAFRRGQSLVYFAGHGSTTTTDVFFGQPGDYRNKGLYPVFLTLSCRTGSFGEPNIITLNETFLRTPEGGAIMALGTTGFGEPFPIRILSEQFFELLRKSSGATIDSLRGFPYINVATAFITAKVYTSSLGISGFLYGSDNSRMQYSVLGDAAMGFALRPEAELAVQPEDMKILSKVGEERNELSLADSFYYAKVRVRNYGFSINKPVHFILKDEGPNGISLSAYDTILTLDTSLEVTARFPLDKVLVGNHNLRATIDFDNEFREVNEKDNEASIPFSVSGSSLSLLSPFDGSAGLCDLTGDSVRFVFLSDADTSKLRIELEGDTGSSFTSSYSIKQIDRAQGVTEFTISRSELRSSSTNIIWWRWRTRNATGETGAWQVGSFSLDKNSTSALAYTSGDQLRKIAIAGLGINSRGALAINTSDTVHYRIISRSVLDSTANDHPISQVLVNENPVFALTEPSFGLLVLTADGGSIEQATEFLCPGAGDSIPQGILAVKFDSIIKLIPDGRRVILLTNFQPFLHYFRQDAKVKAALTSIGSKGKYVDSLDYFGKYVLWGVKNGGAEESVELVLNPSNKDRLEYTSAVVASGNTGRARTAFTTKASSYSKLTWKADSTTAGNDIQVKLLGVRKSGNTIDTLEVALASERSELDLKAIDPTKYERLAADLSFVRGASSVTSPQLSSIIFTYDPAPEFIVEKVTITPQAVFEGEPVVAHYTIRNLLCTDGHDVPLRADQTSQGITNPLFTKVVPLIPGRGSVQFTDTISTVSLIDEVRQTFTVNPNGEVGEQQLHNNQANATFIVSRDSVRPQVDVLFDGRRISECEYVDNRSKITITLADQSPLRQIDSASIVGIIRNDTKGGNPVVLTAEVQEANFNVSFETHNSGTLQAALNITPTAPLEPGNYTLIAIARDASGNPDTLRQCFAISKLNGVEHVMNYPNPFDGKGTDFTFVMRSGGSTSVKIYIYTVAGRKIRTLTAMNVRAGLNIVHWDGRDEAGNEIANGTYLYKVVVDGENPDGSAMNDAIMERAVKIQ